MGYIIPRTPYNRFKKNNNARPGTAIPSQKVLYGSRRFYYIRTRKAYHQKQNKQPQPYHVSIKRRLHFPLPAIQKQQDNQNKGKEILPWPSQIKKSYVISIRANRLDAFRKRMGPWDKQIIHLPGTVGAKLNTKQKLKIRGNQRRFTAGQMGCFDSHARVWKKVIEDNCITLVMEDDASIFYEEEIAQRFAHLFQQLEKNKIQWDFIYLGTYETSVTNKPVAQGIYPCTEWHGLFCYLIKPSAAKVFLKNAFPMKRPVDVYLKQFMEPNSKLKFFKAVPRFGFVVSLTSDTNK